MALSITGCATSPSTIESRPFVASRQSIKRLRIGVITMGISPSKSIAAINNQIGDPSIESKAGAAMTEAFSSAGIAATYQLVYVLPGAPTPLPSNIFKPDGINGSYILMAEQTGTSGGCYGVACTSDNNFKISIIDQKLNMKIWEDNFDLRIRSGGFFVEKINKILLSDFGRRVAKNVERIKALH